MSKENEEEEVVEELEETEVKAEAEPEVEPEETTDWKAKFEETKGRLKRAETKLSKKSEVKETKPTSKSGGMDYGEKAFLTANGIKGAKEFEFVQEELTKSGEELETLLENDYFKTRLDGFRALNKTQDAIPKGSKSSGATIDSVEYWMAKPIDEVPKDMRSKVVNAKLDKDKNKGHFYNS